MSKRIAELLTAMLGLSPAAAKIEFAPMMRRVIFVFDLVCDSAAAVEKMGLDNGILTVLLSVREEVANKDSAKKFYHITVTPVSPEAVTTNGG